MLAPGKQALYLYDALFNWQTPLSLWELSESLKEILGDELLSGRNAGHIEIKKILEGWVTGKTLTMAYHGEPCLVRVTHNPAMDAQIYYAGSMRSVEVTQALYPGRKRNVFGTRFGGFMPPQPITKAEMPEYELYRERFISQAFLQVEKRIEHKYQLYKKLDYLLIYVDLFDMHQPRYSYFALQEFMEEYKDDLSHRLDSGFRARWHDKIDHLFLLNNEPTGFLTHLASPTYHAPLSLA